MVVPHGGSYDNTVFVVSHKNGSLERRAALAIKVGLSSVKLKNEKYAVFGLPLQLVLAWKAWRQEILAGLSSGHC
jgi:hypothetical protein